MARLLFFAVHASVAAAAPPTLVLFLIVLVVAAFVVSLCTSSTHGKLWKQSRTATAPLEKTPAVKAADGGGRKHMLTSSLSGIGSKAAAIAKMVSWNRRSPASGSSSEEEEEEAAAVEDEEAVWRKAILMGDKCRPLQFSGHIAFDADGNQLPPAPAKKAHDDVNVAQN